MFVRSHKFAYEPTNETDIKLKSRTFMTVFKGNKMAPLKINNGGSYALMEYLTCWKCAIFQPVTASCLSL